ncbi:hypothetical protein NQZ71_24870 (plasmid) [Niallia taxi]|uniref:hypothetical protein n=1 Tax=Niallia taxi TaxID=2499688 RepID=UPI0029341ABA|nr:hypothetical protein [Niallia taxi]MED3960997.1 hypothetical protein [Niallia taxi]WOD65143.1 hypothetical protein NQZ71_24870 [Niallia taxi]
MNIGRILLIIGLLMFLAGIYISSNWTVLGSIIGITGGLVLGLSTFYFIKSRPK